MPNTNRSIVVFDTRDGNSFLTNEVGDLLVGLGKHSTLVTAVGEARRLGHQVDGWMRPDVGVVLDVQAIRTPYDK